MAGSNASIELSSNGVKTPAKTGPKGPMKFTPEILAKLEQAFAIDATIEEAAFYAGINAATYYRWREQFPEKCEKLEQLRQMPILTARQTVVNAIKNDPDMALKYLERKRKAEFSTKTESDTTITLAQPILGGMAKKQIDAVHSDTDNV